MKNLILLFTIFSLISVDLMAQSVPEGMRYQAIVRDLDGAILGEKQLSVKVELLSNGTEEHVYFEELHEVLSNKQGLLNFTIGEGTLERGKFSKIPWSSANIWVRISVKSVEDIEYQIINTSQLYSVPYAEFAATAGEVLNKEDTSAVDLSKSPGIGSNSINWRLDGNRNAQNRNDGNPVIGTVDENALVIITDNVPRLIIDVSGNSNFTGEVDIDGDLNTDQGVVLNTLRGSTQIHGATTVENMSSTHLTGSLVVDKGVELNGLSVSDMAPTHLTGTLDVDGALNVDGATTLNSSLDVTGMSPTDLTGTLDVVGTTTMGDGLTVGNMAPTQLTGTLDVDKNLNVDGSTTLNSSLIVTGMNPTLLSGTLVVDKSTTLEAALTVNNLTPSHLTGTLDVDQTLIVGEETTLNSSLDVSGMSPTHLTGTLVVDKLPTLKAGLVVTGVGSLGPGGGDLAFFDNTAGGNKDGIGIQIQQNQVSKENNFMTFYRGDAGTIAGRIEGYQFSDIQNIPTPTSDEIWTAVCIAVADYNPITISWTQMANKWNLLAGFWNNTTTPSFDIPDIPAFNIPDIPPLAIPDIPAFVIPDVPGFVIPDIPGVVIPNLGPLDVGPYLCATINECFCFCDITQVFGSWDCCCVDEEVCVIPSFRLFPEINIPDFPGIPIPDFAGIPIPDFPGIPIPDFPGLTIPDFPGLVIPEVPSINLSSVFGSLPEIPTFNDILVSEGICPNADIFNLETGYFARLAGWAFEHRLQNLVTIDPVALVGNALAWSATTYVLDNGVVYGSQGADYAEYLTKLNTNEKFLKGEIVGVYNGMISKNTKGADQILAITSNPLLLGNMPDVADEKNYEKVAFLGQVPLYVNGPVAIGDYIIPSGKNDGIGMSVAPGSLTVDMISQVLGVAWSAAEENGLAVVNASIGLRPTEVSFILKQQGLVENDIQNQINVNTLDSEVMLSDVEYMKQQLGIAERTIKK